MCYEAIWIAFFQECDLLVSPFSLFLFYLSLLFPIKQTIEITHLTLLSVL